MKISTLLFASSQAQYTTEGYTTTTIRRRTPPHPSVFCPRSSQPYRVTGNTVITSPGFEHQGHYINRRDCTWEVEMDASVKSFTIYPEFFEVEGDENCRRDFLKISFGDSSFTFCSVDFDMENFEPYTASYSSSDYSSYGSSYSGYSPYQGDFNHPLKVIGNKATIRFKSDSFTVFKGFKLRLEID
ncbi:Oidioi.mRNA.OKI2018_I69.chr1.g536.t1.cds [Oikopleura dioica]|uniref:Oidioi.mRNA.OKI2018_I69.chr1.g530.t1.cds n=1 Tax=Oikopleura dioica TaxID=34765 RepID=A0ABN7SP08_OIKDI|nr:Oidioi.mRNA.OKI2018_I69.chr1.g530.t1.cds [Oikopleura dioica]CAG5102935.1 Oidioi.mRNA.OKI2018_I69.chr1.g536.t1.cds [Oikopleura dioica]